NSEPRCDAMLIDKAATRVGDACSVRRAAWGGSGEWRGRTRFNYIFGPIHLRPSVSRRALVARGYAVLPVTTQCASMFRYGDSLP
ncbi:hypothetical protein COCCADRAFT_86492, partial [Bipolaris zeicola 26-R-13]